MSSTLVTDTMATRPCDARTLLRQITPGILMSCGARNIVTTGDGVAMDVSRGGRRLVIKLAADDTYTVERTRGRGVRTVSEAVRHGVYADMLPEIVRRLGDV